MATTDLGFNVFAIDRAGRTFEKLAQKVDMLERKLSSLDRKRVSPKVDVDTRKANLSLSRLEQRLDRLSRGRFVANVAMAAAPLAIPAAAGALAGGGGIAAIGAGGAAAIGGFAAVSAAQLKIINDTLKKADELSADGHKKAAERLMNSLSDMQLKTAAAVDKLKGTWSDFLSTGGGAAVLAPLSEGIGALSQALPALSRFLRPVAESFGSMFDIIGDDMATKAFRQFSAMMGEFAATVTAQGIGATINLAQAFANLFEAFIPLGNEMGQGLVSLTQRFENWTATVGSSKGFRKFVEYASQTGPQLVKTLAAIGSALLSVGKALAPLAAVMLRGIEIFAEWVAKTAKAHPEFIQMAGAIGVAAAAVSALSRPLGAIVGLFTLIGTGPVGIAIAAIAAVGIAMVIAYKKSEAFRNVVKSVVGWVRDDLFPALVQLKDAALRGLSEAWENVQTSAGDNRPLLKSLGDIFKTLGTVLVKAVIPAMMWWVTNVWPALGRALGFGVTLLRKIISWHLRMVEVGARAYKGLFTAASWVFGKILDAAAWGLGWIPKLGPKIEEAKAGFDRFRVSTTNNLDRIASRAKSMREELNKPAKLEVETDQASNTIGNFITTTKGKFRDLGNETFAIMVNGQSGHGRITKKDGGFISGPGGPRDDRIPAALSNGEFVVNAASTSRHRPLLESINRQKFADGGMVGQPTLQVKADMSDLRGLVKETLAALRSSAGGGGLTAKQIARGLSFARSQVGDPYVWGGVGPNGYDCSGFQSAVFNAARGLNPYHRLGSTGTMPWPHMQLGQGGAYQIGWFTGNPGHTAGTLGGVNVESSGGVGVRVGGKARGANDPMFNRHAYFTTAAGRSIPITMGGGDAPGGDMRGRSPAAARRWARDRVPSSQFGALNALWNRESGWHWNANNPHSSAYGIPQALPGSKMGAAGPDWKTNPATQMQWGLNYIKSRYGSPRAAWGHSQATGWYDGGGVLKPGLTRALNTSGRDELVLTHNEIKALSRAFKLSKGTTHQEARSELNELIRALKDNLGKDSPVVTRIERMADNTLKSVKSTEDLRKQMASAKENFQSARTGMRDLSQATSSYYGGALFGEGQGLEAFGNAKQLASGAKAFQRNLRRLHRKGLSDSLLRQIASSTDFESAAALAGMDPHALKRLNRLNKVQMKAAHEVGQYAGHAVFGDEFHHAKHRMRQMERRTERHENRLDEHDEKRIERAMRRAMHGAHIKIRDGGRDRDADLLLRTGL